MHVILRVSWRLVLPWGLALFLLGFLVGAYWREQKVQEQMNARITELKAGKEVAEAALSSFAPTKFNAADAKRSVIRERNGR